ncbi:ABC transporter permease [Verminephrobacter aporrectodeae]|uniref:ABC transporter permease n=1 Tax=Verminephrobacter aporrectodeae subsp. tuberculatae TaxID=1110392 RepID=A0ABT3KWJ5_9BURK|nr:ABC transporter permease [Verminephrobacter aporrectodeae]MCW5221840.1 ABC transporter permease [Verminephrobacter aporrectodeae subsp. tuberculatae]MCW5258150.1 ABC transporter permease [Verminephrobacter aporrectodeae subsp. tuberculatae]MCW5291131.1 ABC transporter permease [Verminephrobacter aporrectodeae subsp. tuberculatae]MCW5322707.1 ABC transporter permease [Verminephrobacter aporrectodeae subsp. tuberculatae]MCW8163657.1 ABC transporter permease [Verminephrobacter aporrectodeae su
MNTTAPAAARKTPVNWRDFVIYIVFAALFIFFSATLHDKGFLDTNNLMNIARQTAMISIMAVGMTFVLSAGEIDLSFGAIVALSAVTAALTLQATESIWLAVGAALFAGTAFGLVNGWFVAVVGIPSFLVTLGMTGIITGVTRWITQLQSIPVSDERFVFLFGSGDVGPVSVLFLWMLAVALLGHLALNRTRFGKEVTASGGNQTAALYSGIRVARIKLLVLVLNAFLAALAGILYAGRLQSARYTLGENDLMMVIAAVIIGGTSLFGGKGTVVGSIVGALIMGMVNNGLVLMGLNVDQQLIFRGVIIILAVTFTMGQLRSKRAAKKK